MNKISDMKNALAKYKAIKKIKESEDSIKLYEKKR